MDFILGWSQFFLDFSVRWRAFSRADESLVLDYDDFLADKFAYTKRLVQFLDAETFDEAALREAFEHYDQNTDRGPTAGGSLGHKSDVKFNVGVAGQGGVYSTNPLYQAVEAHLLAQAPDNLAPLFRFPNQT